MEQKKKKLDRWQSRDRVRKRKGWVGGGQREKKGLHWPLSDIATIGISQTMAAAADMSMHIW